MKLNVPVTKTVEVHVHNFFLSIRHFENAAQPTYMLTCLCGNGEVLLPKSGTTGAGWYEDQIEITALLEAAASEQDRKHKDW